MTKVYPTIWLVKYSNPITSPLWPNLPFRCHNLEDKHKITCKHCECEHLLKQHVWIIFQRPKPVQEHRNRTINNFSSLECKPDPSHQEYIPFAIHQCDLLLPDPASPKKTFLPSSGQGYPTSLKRHPVKNHPHLSNHRQHCSQNNLTLNSISKTFYPKHIWSLYIIPFHELLHPWQCEIPVFFATEPNLWQIEEGPSITTFCSPPLNCASEKINLIGKLSTFSTKP